MNVETQFKKGQKPWNYGLVGYMGPNKTSFVKGRVPHNKGKKHPTGEVHAKNITGMKFGRWTVMERTLFKSKNNYWMWLCVCECGIQRAISTQSLRSGASKSCGCLRLDAMHSRKGKVFQSDAAKRKLSESHKGSLNPRWRGGITTEVQKSRNLVELKLWKKACLQRDNYSCQKTGAHGGRLAVHHIKNFSSFPDLRTAVHNGITLDFEVHKEFHRIYGVKHNTLEQIEEFIGRQI